MSDEQSSPARDELRRIWDANAAFWDEYVGPAGNAFHRVLVSPAQMRLLALAPGERVLEFACGNGQFTREMTVAGAHVLATDISSTFVERARKHTEAAGLKAEFAVCDATEEADIAAISGERHFDAVVCTMAIHDIATLDPMMRAVNRLLEPGGRFVFSVMHPCFNASILVENADDDGEVSTRYSLKIRGYLDHAPELGPGILGQPEPHWYFPRTMAELLAPAFAAGLVLDGLEEPAFHPGMEEPERPFSWKNYPSIPPVLVVRLRPSGES
jgi:2-polyprenyl-3-methyl-5-hydroxy-6-metoxy-1,4-benzoquinol methylase